MKHNIDQELDEFVSNEDNFTSDDIQLVYSHEQKLLIRHMGCHRAEELFDIYDIL